MGRGRSMSAADKQRVDLKRAKRIINLQDINARLSEVGGARAVPGFGGGLGQKAFEKRLTEVKSLERKIAGGALYGLVKRGDADRMDSIVRGGQQYIVYTGKKGGEGRQRYRSEIAASVVRENGKYKVSTRYGENRVFDTRKEAAKYARELGNALRRKRNSEL